MQNRGQIILHRFHNAQLLLTLILVNSHGPDVEIIMCWFHMRRAVADKLPTYIKDLAKQARFLSDLDHLQVAKIPEIFDIALDLFMKKWRAESEKMMDYFEREWVQKCPNWYEAFAKRIPSTNNGLESRNRLIKDEHVYIP